MNKREEIEIGKRFLEVYCGILFTAPTFEKGQKVDCFYDFTNSKYDELKSHYHIVQIGGKGGDFQRALRICQWLAAHLSHKGDFSLTSNIEYNSISLLDYAFGNSEHGLNCVCKAKILVECCLALGIAARRIGLYPNSPFDTDNHVVAEIYDRERKKWIMLDATSGGYFTDGKNPLSCLEMRDNFALNAGGSIVLPNQKPNSLDKLNEKNISWNYYYAKNCYYMTVETVSSFGETDAVLAYLLPIDFDIKAYRKKNAEYMLKTAIKECWGEAAINSLEKQARSVEDFVPFVGSTALWSAPKL
ncbi:MAG: transglutaminase domain-containing protein [Clostridiales bacterium]|nr:transglutaminase domain-containing protein [Clostridiales bacterium]